MGYTVFIVLCFISVSYSQVQTGSGVWSTLRQTVGDLTILNGDIILSDDQHLIGEGRVTHCTIYSTDTVGTTLATGGIWYQFENTFALLTHGVSELTLLTDSLMWTAHAPNDTLILAIVVPLSTQSDTNFDNICVRVERNGSATNPVIGCLELKAKNIAGDISFNNHFVLGDSDIVQIEIMGDVNGAVALNKGISITLWEIGRW